MPRFVGSPRDSDCPWTAAWDPADEAFVAFAVAVVAGAVAARLFQPVDCLSLLARCPACSLAGRSSDNSETHKFNLPSDRGARILSIQSKRKKNEDQKKGGGEKKKRKTKQNVETSLFFGFFSYQFVCSPGLYDKPRYDPPRFIYLFIFFSKIAARFASWKNSRTIRDSSPSFEGSRCCVRDKVGLDFRLLVLLVSYDNSKF